jgi:Lon protease-like protein
MSRSLAPSVPWQTFDPARTELLPILALADTVLFPGMCSSVTLTSVAAYGAAREAARVQAAPRLGVFTVEGTPGASTLFAIGTVAVATNLRKCADGEWAVDVRALFRARRHPLVRSEPFRIAPVEILPDDATTPAELAAFVCPILAAARRLRGAHPCAAAIAMRLRDAPADMFAAIAAPLLECAPVRDRQEILEAESLPEQLGLLLAHLHATAQARKPF